jgi:hypothetical protein
MSHKNSDFQTSWNLCISAGIFQVKFRRWLSGLLNHTLDSDIKVLNHVLLALASDHDKQKTKPNTKFVAKNKLVESTDHEAGLSDATSTEVRSQISDEDSGSTVWLSIHNFYLHFTKVTRKCECFGRIVEPCNSQKYEET